MQSFRKCAPYAHWLLRLSLASVFLYHGLTKFPALNEVAPLVGLPVWLFTVVAVAETLAGVFILVGPFFSDLLTRLAGGIMAVVMVGAVVLVHCKTACGWNFMTGGIEFNVTLFALGLFFLIKGNGGSCGANSMPAGKMGACGCGGNCKCGRK